MTPRYRPAWAGAHRVALADGGRVLIRPLRAADLALAPQFYAALSPRTRYLRLMQQSPTLPPSTLAQLRAQLQDPRASAFAVVVAHASAEEIVGGGRIVPTRRRARCEFALTVIDCWQGRGVGHVVLAELVHRARALGYSRIEGYALSINAGMIALAARTRMRVEPVPDDPTLVRLSRHLYAVDPRARWRRTRTDAGIARHSRATMR